MSTSSNLVRSRWLIRASLVLLVGCGSSTGLDTTKHNIQLKNQTDNFEFQASSLENVSDDVSYNWENTGTTANVDISGSITAGSATLTVTDGGGTQVFSQSLTQTGSTTTMAGTAGTWGIRVQISGVSGTLNFRLQKP